MKQKCSRERTNLGVDERSEGMKRGNHLGHGALLVEVDGIEAVLRGQAHRLGVTGGQGRGHSGGMRECLGTERYQLSRGTRGSGWDEGWDTP